MAGNMVRRVSFNVAEAKIRALGNVLGRPMRDVLESSARVVATQMARSAQPFGTGNEAQQSGKKAVARDILKVYALAKDAYEDISLPFAKAVFWKAYKSGEFDVAERILRDFGRSLRGLLLGPFDGGTLHKAARDRTTGRVREKRPALIVTDPKALFRYIEDVQKNVGFGKGGFADIARALGKAPRGLREDGDITANWITRHTGFGKFHAGGTEQEPTIFIQSTVPYADHILTGGALSDAKRIGKERMLENLRIAVSAEVKKLRQAA